VTYRGIAKVQHYVPQFLLRNFGKGKKHHLHVFDKQTGRAFETNAKNVAGESRFYDFEFKGHKLSLEPSLSQLESKAKPLLHRLLHADTVRVLSTEERAVLSVFFAVQFTRTRAFRQQWRSIPEMLAQRLRRSVNSDEDLKHIEHLIQIPDENQTTLEVARFMLDASKQFAPHFASKTWLLLQTDRRSPFQIGDNPLALQNSIDMGPYGNIGLAVRGIEIYLPLSPSRALAMWCPSHEDTFRKAASDLRRISTVAPEMVAAHVRDPSGIEETATAMETGHPLRFKPDNVLNFNSLQILYAERYVFSNVDDFALAREMIASHPDARSGPRVRMD
jgi:hypothetical protein